MSVADKMLKEIVTLAKKVARQEHETGGLWDKNQQLEDERDNLAAEVEALKTQLENAQRELSEQSMVANVETQQDAAAWQQQLDAARAEIETLKGAMAADDRRLRNAEERIWPGKTWGCDAADKMADEIETLRTKLVDSRVANINLQGQLDAARAETVETRKRLNEETDRHRATNAEKVDLFQKLQWANQHNVELVRERDAALAAVTLQRAGIERLQKCVGKVRSIMDREYDGLEFEHISGALVELDAEPTPVAEPLDAEGGK